MVAARHVHPHKHILGLLVRYCCRRVSCDPADCTAEGRVPVVGNVVIGARAKLTVCEGLGVAARCGGVCGGVRGEEGAQARGTLRLVSAAINRPSVRCGLN